MSNWQKLGSNFWTHVSKPYEYINGLLRDSNTKQLVLDYTDLTESPPFPVPSVPLVFPPGLVLPYGGSTVPSGNWALLLSTGINVSRSTYALLFAVIGTTFGSGDGSTTFGLPSTAGIHLRGVGTSTGYTSPRTITLAQVVNDQFQGHYHNFQNKGAQNGSDANWGVGGVNASVVSNSVLAPVTDGTNGTPRTGDETAVKAIGVNYIITTGLPA